MAKPAITKRQVKGSALTYSELDTNFQNLRDSTINFTGDAGDTRSMDLNDATAITGERNIRVTVDEATQTIKVRNSLSEFAKDPIGFENITDAAISFDSGTRIFTIQPAVTSYNMWYQGTQYTITTAKTVTIPNTTGTYVIYFQNDTLNYAAATEPDWSTQVPVSYVYWNANTNEALYSKELHTISMDWKTKEYLHETQAAAYADGLNASNFTVLGDGSLDSHAQLDISNGVIYDQDIPITITHSNTPTLNTWEQDLQGPARIPVLYQFGTTGTWELSGPLDFPLVNGITRVSYNLNTAGTWTIPDATNTYFVAYWIVATNFVNNPIIAIMGQRQDNKLDDAAANNTWASLDLTNFPAEEFRPLYRIIARTADAYTNTPKAYFAQLDDVRQTVIVPVSAGGTGSGTVNDGVSGALAYYPANGTTVDDSTFTQVGTGHLSSIGANNLILSTNSNGPGAKITLTTGTNGPATLAAGGTGAINLNTNSYVAINSGIYDAVLTSVGTLDLILTTNTGASGSGITIGGNTNEDITINPRGQGNIVAVCDRITIGDGDSPAQITTASNATLVIDTGGDGSYISVGAGTNANLYLAGSGTGLVQVANDLDVQTGVIGTSTTNGNIEIEPNGTGKIIATAPISSTVAHGTASLDTTTTDASYAINATVDFANFSGMIIINNTGTTGNVALWLCGGGTAVKVSDTVGNSSGTITSVGGINGYRWTNTTGITDSFSFAAVKTRTTG